MPLRWGRVRTASGVPSPALTERSGRPPPRRRNLARLRYPSPARRALSRCGLLGLNKGEQRGRRPRDGRAVSEAGRRPRGPRALGRGRHGGEGAGKREEPRRAGGGRAAGRPGSAPRYPPRAAGPRRSVFCGRRLPRSPRRTQPSAGQPSTRCSAGPSVVFVLEKRNELVHAQCLLAIIQFQKPKLTLHKDFAIIE